MAGSTPAANATMLALRDFAMSFPGAVEGIACAGTSLEKRTVKARNKAFVFLGTKDVMVKLQDSLPAVAALAKREPDCFRVGAHGWLTMTYGETQPALDQLRQWLDESYRLLAPKDLVDELDQGGPHGSSSRNVKNKATKPTKVKPSAARQTSRRARSTG